jgi:hypothetical protein
LIGGLEKIPPTSHNRQETQQTQGVARRTVKMQAEDTACQGPDEFSGYYLAATRKSIEKGVMNCYQ